MIKALISNARSTNINVFCYIFDLIAKENPSDRLRCDYIFTLHIYCCYLGYRHLNKLYNNNNDSNVYKKSLQ